MTVASRQAKGSAAAILFDREAGFKTPRTGSAKRPIRIAFNSSSLAKTVSLEEAQTITGDRNPAAPFEGNVETGGDLVVPIDKDQVGYLLRGLIGAPATVETPTADRKTGTPTVTIASGTGAYTFSVGQTSSVAGDRVIYEKDGVRYAAFITTRTNDTTGTLSVERDAATPAPNVTGATVVAIVPNLAETSPGDCTITDGVLTFAAPQANDAIGRQVIYQTNKRAIIVSAAGTDAWNVVDGVGRTPANTGGAVDVEAIEERSHFTHTFTIDPSANLDSWVIEQGHVDLPVPYFLRFTGLKLNQLQMTVTPTGEVTGTASFLGANATKGFQPYDHESHMTGSPTISLTSGAYTFSAAQASSALGDVVIYTPSGATTARLGIISARTDNTTGTLTDENGDTPDDVSGATVEAIYSAAASDSSAVALYAERFNAGDATIALNGTTSEIVTSFTLSIGNNLDGDSRTIFGGGERRHIAEGKAAVGGSFEALFESEELLAISASGENVSFALAFSQGGESLTFTVPVAKIQDSTPPITSGGGIRVSGDWFGYKPAGGASAVTAVLVSNHEHFA